MLSKILLLFLFVISTNSFGRCNGTYADSILAKALDCKGENVSLTDLENIEKVAFEVSITCGKGCYSPQLDGTQRAECDKSYAKVLLDAESQISSFSKKRNCNFDIEKIKEIANGSQQDSGPFGSCFWVSSSVVTPKNISCGRTSACIGQGYCFEGEYANQSLQLQCPATSSGECPSFSACANSDDPAWLNLDGVQSNKDIQRKDSNSGKVLQL